MAAAASLGSAFSPGASSSRSGTNRNADFRTDAGSQTRPHRVSVSSMYLLDTNVVSELRKNKPHGAVVQWIRDVAEAALHISAVTIGEIQAGVEVTRDQDVAKAAEIEQWLDLVA